MDIETTNQVYLITGIILAILLATSEVLGWSKCDANSISQIPFCLTCRGPLNKVDVQLERT
jgi:hypothetical protein